MKCFRKSAWLALPLLLCCAASAQFVQGTGSPLNTACFNRPLAVGTGNFHTSGHVDLVVTCDSGSTPGSAKVFPGTGNGTFSLPNTTPATTGIFPTSLVVADFDGDGKPDLAVVNLTDATVSVYKGDGAGGFTLQVTLGQGQGIGTNPVYVTTADINGDLRPDLLVVNQADGTVTVLLNTGSFSFSGSTLTTTGTNPAWVTAGFFNNDPFLDLAVVNNGGSTVDIFLSTGSGFLAPATFQVGGNPSAIVTGDFNGDGKFDLAVTNPGGTVSVLLGNGDGTFQARTTVTGVGNTPSAMVVGDFNDDGILDLAIADKFAAGATVAVLLGTGSGGFNPASGSPYALVGQQATSIVTDDFNDDGKLDLAVVTTSGVNVLLNTGLVAEPLELTIVGSTDPSAPPPPGAKVIISAQAGTNATFTASPSQPWLSVSPGSGSTATPLSLTVTASPAGLSAGLHFGAINVTAPGHFGTSIPVTFDLVAPSGVLLAAAGSPFATGTGPETIVSADFDNDGIPDLAIANQTSSSVTILKGDGAGGFTPFSASPILLDVPPFAIAAGDFNGDGRVDIAVTDTLNGSVSVFLGSGTGAFFGLPPFNAGPNPTSITVADFDGDGNLDLAFSNTTLLFGDGHGNFAPDPFIGVQSGPAGERFVASGDFNGDGLPDLAVVDQTNSTLSIFLNTGLGGFTPAAGSPYSTGATPQGVAVGDFNLDGKLDLVTANSGAFTVSVFVGNGAGGFAAATGSPYSVAAANAVVVTDINGDGKPDIISLGGSGQVSILLGNGAGGFTPSVGGAISGGAAPFSAVAGDFNGDGRRDLAFADFSGNNVTVLLGASAQTQNTLSTTAPPSVPAGTQVPLMAQVIDSVAGFQTPTGTVTFKDGAATVATVGLSAGVANFSSTYPSGNHTFTAVYSGDLRNVVSTSSSVSVMVTPGPSASIAATAGGAQTTTVQTAFATAFQALVADAQSNPVPGIAVTFTAPLNGASGTFPGAVTSVMVTTNASGIAKAPLFTANQIAGSYNVSATAAGVATPALYALTNQAGPPATVSAVSGQTQSAPLNSAFSVPLVVTVKDSFGNFVPGALVTFTGPAGGPGGSFSSGVTATAITNAAGQGVAPTFTANAVPGSYVVNATVTRLTTPAVFTLTNTAGAVAIVPTSVTFALTLPASILPNAKTLQLSAAGQFPFNVTVNTASGGNWLSATPSSGTTPAAVTVSLLTAALALAPGAYSGSITVQSFTNQTVVPVTLTVSAPFDPIVNGLSFVFASGNSAPPASQTINITSSNRPLPFTVSVPATVPWLFVSPQSATTAAPLTVSVNPSNLAPGSYSASVAINSPFASNGPLIVPISLVVQAVTTASPSSLTFVASAGQNPSAVQSLLIGGTSGISFSAQASSSWIVVSPSSGLTPSSVSVKVDPSGLAPGSYFGSISISGAGATSISIPVSVTIQAALDVVAGSGNGAIFLMPTATPGVFAADTTIVTNTTGSTFTASGSGQGLIVTPASGTLPTVLHTSVDAGKLAPGTYTGAVTLNIPDANPASRMLAVSFTVNPPQPAQVMTQAPGLTFSLSSAAPTASREALASNLGSGTINFTATANQPWIQVSPATGSSTSVGAAPISIDLDLSGFSPGTYHGVITVASASNSVTIPVNVAVSSQRTGIALSQTGLTFSTVAGGSAPPAQSFQVLNTGIDPFAFQVSASTTSGGSSWLSSTPSAGSTDKAPAVQVSVNPAGLAAGTYYGQVQILSAANPQQSVTVVLNVAPSGALVRPSVTPSGLIFTASANGSNPAVQTIAIQNPTAAVIKFVSTPIYTSGVNWFSYSPLSGQIAAGQTQIITVAATPVSLTRALAAGVYRAQLNLGFIGYDSVQPIDLLLVVTPQSGKSPGQAHATTATCAPTKLLPVFTMLGGNFSVSAGFPAAIEVRVVDDCANFLTAGSVVTTFSNGDPPLSLKTLSDGRWAATWAPRNPTANIVITGSAALNVSSTVRLTGAVQIMGNAQTNPLSPIVASGGIVNAASFSKNAPVPPGALVTIFGTHLADQQTSATVLPLPNLLSTTSATIDGANLPLLFASDGQVNGVIPFALQQNVTHLLVVTRGNAISVPEPVTIANAQPAVFTADGSGGGQGVVLGFLNGGAQVLADSTHPVSAGGYIVLYATGLGAVTPAVPDGIAGPSFPLSTVSQPISLKIGGADATITYAGLAPGFASLYQVNAIVPVVTPGNSVPLVITVGGQDSPPVTIAVK